MIEEVFKKGKKQKEVAKKFDEKIAQKQGSGKKRDKFQQFKKQVSGLRIILELISTKLVTIIT